MSINIDGSISELCNAISSLTEGKKGTATQNKEIQQLAQTILSSINEVSPESKTRLKQTITARLNNQKNFNNGIQNIFRSVFKSKTYDALYKLNLQTNSLEESMRELTEKLDSLPTYKQRTADQNTDLLNRADEIVKQLETYRKGVSSTGILSLSSETLEQFQQVAKKLKDLPRNARNFLEWRLDLPIRYAQLSEKGIEPNQIAVLSKQDLTPNDLDAILASDVPVDINERIKLCTSHLDNELFVKIISNPELVPTDRIAPLMSLFPRAASSYKIKEFVGYLEQMPVADRGAFIDLSLRCIPFEFDAITIIKDVAADQRAAFVTHCETLMPLDRYRNVFRYIKLDVIRTLRNIPPEVRAEVVLHAAPLFQLNLSVNDIRAPILERIRLFHAEERQQRVEHVLRGFQDGRQTDHHQILAALEEAGLVERPQAAAAQPQAARGMYVHSGPRDPRTRNAFQLLRNTQGQMTEQEIERAKNQFVTHLEGQAPSEIRSRAIKALLGPTNGENGDFPPLLNGTRVFSIAGLELTGQEVIGRLWRFAETYTDAKNDTVKERENMKRAMILALNDSIEEDGHVVCNPGKTQRLLTAVLQGRLEGMVPIDEVPVVEETATEQPAAEVPIDTNTALGLFFRIPANQEILMDEEAEEATLLQAANTYCNENPRVQREPFLAGIRAAWAERGV